MSAFHPMLTFEANVCPRPMPEISGGRLRRAGAAMAMGSASTFAW